MAARKIAPQRGTKGGFNEKIGRLTETLFATWPHSRMGTRNYSARMSERFFSNVPGDPEV